jgi:hypothetical protein
VLAEYADGKPGPAEPEPEEAEDGSQEQLETLVELLLPPNAASDERAALRKRLGLPDNSDLDPPVLGRASAPAATSG